MTDVTVDPAALAGFESDLTDMGANFISNASRFLPGTALPVGTTGLMATLTPSFEKSQTAISTAQRTDSIAIEMFRTNLSASAASYRATDGATASAVSAASTGLPSGSGAADPAGAGQGVNRFSGLQLPGFPDVSEVEYSVRRVLTAAIDQIQVYDDDFAVAIGLKPVADYLAPLVADWEALQAIGQRIGWLGINDYVTSENLVNGTRWLQNSWTGDAAQSFGTGTGTAARTMADRSIDLDAVAKIVENGGLVLTRLVYNQAVGLSDLVLKSISHQEASFPLGVWASLINNPMPESLRTEIRSALDGLRSAAESRHTTITTMLEKVSAAVDYAPGRKAAVYSPVDFEVPEKIVVDPGVAKYGFGDNVWWEESNASAG
ncbi:hypothetical protein [Nocardia sienata]|uniref:hypothetical protein n=1 Tax=Nocardia sienata TaxID=248552 RepID=UPI0007A39D1C|nr:hypothetical protein [Nocardia sienata]